MTDTDTTSLAVVPDPAPDDLDAPAVREPDTVAAPVAAAIMAAIETVTHPAQPVVLVLTLDQAYDLAVLAEFGAYARDTIDPMISQMAPMMEQLGGGIMGRIFGGKG